MAVNRARLEAIARRQETPEQVRARHTRALIPFVDRAIARNDPNAIKLARELHELMGYVPGAQQQQTAQVQIVVEHTDDGDAQDPAEQAAIEGAPPVH